MTSLITNLPESFLNKEFFISTESFPHLIRDFKIFGSEMLVDSLVLIQPFMG